MTFNFSTYLSKIDPTQTYAIEQLTGGVVNLTVRATKKTSTASSQGLLPLNASLILKQAPPYVAGVGESAPMSQFRQVFTSLYIIQPFMLTLPTQDNRSACIIAVRTPEQATAHNLCRVVRRGPNTPSSRPRGTCADCVGHWSSSEPVRNLLQSWWLHPPRITYISLSTRICFGRAIGLLRNSWTQDRLFLCTTAFPIQYFLYHQLSAPWSRIPLQSNYERCCP
jgi:hypothetical protein